MNIKDRIKQSAKEKFCYYGFKNVRTDDLAKSVGISKKTLYEHYASKEALFEEIFEEAVEREHKLIGEYFAIEGNRRRCIYRRIREYLFA